MYKKYFSNFLTLHPQIQNYSCHQQPVWPDVALGCKPGDKLEDKIFSAKKLIAQMLHLSHPEQIAFASTQSELVSKILHGLGPKKNISILTTDSEMYNFDDLPCSLEKISTQPFDNFESNIIKKISGNHYDLIFFSQVLFNSGMVVRNLNKIVSAVKEKNTLIVIDGRNGFMAIPTDLKEHEERVYYLAGDDGCFFLTKPEISNWETEATVDLVKLDRLEAVLTLFKKEGLTVEKIHGHIQMLQNNFRDHLLELDHPYLTEKNILSVDYSCHGHFLTFVLPSQEHAKNLHDQLRALNIWTDFIGNRLRFGFGIYQNDFIDLRALVKPF